MRPVIALDKGAELGWFNMGSTVILMFAAAGPALVPGLAPGQARAHGRAHRDAADESQADWRPAASLEVMRQRAAMLARARAWFASEGVLEVQTPLLSTAAVSEPQIESIAAAPLCRVRRCTCRPRPSTR